MFQLPLVSYFFKDQSPTRIDRDSGDSPSCIDLIPDETLAHIFSFLEENGPKNYNNLCLVNNRFKQVAQDKQCLTAFFLKARSLPLNNMSSEDVFEQLKFEENLSKKEPKFVNHSRRREIEEDGILRTVRGPIDSDGQHIVFINNQGLIQVNDLEGNGICSFDAREDVRCITIKNEKIFTISEHHIKTWDFKGNSLKSFENENSLIFYDIFDDRLIAQFGESMLLLDLELNKIIQNDVVLNDFNCLTIKIQCSKNNIIILGQNANNYESKIKILDLKDEKEIKEEKEAKEEKVTLIDSIQSPSYVKVVQEKIIVGFHTGSVKIWDLEGNLLKEFKPETYGVKSIAVFNDRIFTIGTAIKQSGKLLEMWDFEGNRLLSKQFNFEELDFLKVQDNKLIIGTNYNVHIWDPSETNAVAKKDKKESSKSCLVM